MNNPTITLELIANILSFPSDLHDSEEYNEFNQIFLVNITSFTEWQKILQSFKLLNHSSKIALFVYINKVNTSQDHQRLLNSFNSDVNLNVKIFTFGAFFHSNIKFFTLLQHCTCYIHLNSEDIDLLSILAISLEKQVICYPHVPFPNWLTVENSFIADTQNSFEQAIHCILNNQMKTNLRQLLIQQFETQIRYSLTLPEGLKYNPELSLAIEDFQSESIEQGIKRCQKIITQTPQALPKIELLADYLCRRFSYEKYTEFIFFILNCPVNLSGNYLTGQLFNEKGRLNDALNFYERALLVAPEYTKAIQAKNDTLNRIQHRESLPGIFLNTMPKSGSVYISKTIQSGLDIEFYFISPAYFLSDIFDKFKLHQLVTQGGAISQAHIFPHPINRNLLNIIPTKMIIHVRDPRQALLSFIHHVNKNKDKTDVIATLDIGVEICSSYFTLNLEEQIDFMIEYYYPLLIGWLEAWLHTSKSPEFKSQIMFTRYEDFHQNANEFYLSILKFYNIEPRFFKAPEFLKQKGRLHYRAGKIDEWREVFNSSQIEKVNRGLPQEIYDFFGWSSK